MACEGLGAFPALDAPELGSVVIRRRQHRGATPRECCRLHIISIACEGLETCFPLNAREAGGGVTRCGQHRDAISRRYCRPHIFPMACEDRMHAPLSMPQSLMAVSQGAVENPSSLRPSTRWTHPPQPLGRLKNIYHTNRVTRHMYLG